MKQINRLQTFALAALLLLAAGCAQEPTDLPGGYIAPGTPVAVNFDLPGITSATTATRAALAANTTMRIVPFNVSRMQVETIVTYYVDANGKLAPCTVNADGSFAAVSTTKMKLMMGDMYNFYVATPALPTKSDTDLRMAVSNGVDFASSITNHVTIAPTNVASLPLTQLTRYTAQIKLVLKSTNASVTSLKAAGTGMGLSNLPNNVNTSFSLGDTGSDYGLDLTNSDGTQMLISAASNATQTDAKTITYAPVYILSKQGKTGLMVSATVEITVLGVTKTVTYSTTLPIGTGSQFEVGKSYTVTLDISPESATAIPSVQVTDWTEVGAMPTRSYPYVIANADGKKSVIVTKDLFGQEADRVNLVTPSFHEPWLQTPICAVGTDADLPNSPPSDAGYSYRFEVAQTDNPSTTLTTQNGSCTAPWRLPTISELRIMQHIRGKLEITGFSVNIPYWSATQDATGTMYWLIDNIGSRFIATSPPMYAYPIRCVRDYGILSPAYTYVRNGREIVSQDEYGTTGGTFHPNWTAATMPEHYRDDPEDAIAARFEVAKEYSTNGGNWFFRNEAVAYCAAYSEQANQSDKGKWRLPTLKEGILMWQFRAQQTAAGMDAYPEKLEMYVASKIINNHSTNVGWGIAYAGSNGGMQIFQLNAGEARCVRDL